MTRSRPKYQPYSREPLPPKPESRPARQQTQPPTRREPMTLDLLKASRFFESDETEHCKLLLDHDPGEQVQKWREQKDRFRKIRLGEGEIKGAMTEWLDMEWRGITPARKNGGIHVLGTRVKLVWMKALVRGFQHESRGGDLGGWVRPQYIDDDVREFGTALEDGNENRVKMITEEWRKRRASDDRRSTLNEHGTSDDSTQSNRGSTSKGTSVEEDEGEKEKAVAAEGKRDGQVDVEKEEDEYRTGKEENIVPSKKCSVFERTYGTEGERAGAGLLERELVKLRAAHHRSLAASVAASPSLRHTGNAVNAKLDDLEYLVAKLEISAGEDSPTRHEHRADASTRIPPRDSSSAARSGRTVEAEQVTKAGIAVEESAKFDMGHSLLGEAERRDLERKKEMCESRGLTFLATAVEEVLRASTHTDQAKAHLALRSLMEMVMHSAATEGGSKTGGMGQGKKPTAEWAAVSKIGKENGKVVDSFKRETVDGSTVPDEGLVDGNHEVGGGASDSSGGEKCIVSSGGENGRSGDEGESAGIDQDADPLRDDESWTAMRSQTYHHSSSTSDPASNSDEGDEEEEEANNEGERRKTRIDDARTARDGNRRRSTRLSEGGEGVHSARDYEPRDLVFTRMACQRKVFPAIVLKKEGRGMHVAMIPGRKGESVLIDFNLYEHVCKESEERELLGRKQEEDLAGALENSRSATIRDTCFATGTAFLRREAEERKSKADRQKMKERKKKSAVNEVR